MDLQIVVNVGHIGTIWQSSFEIPFGFSQSTGLLQHDAQIAVRYQNK